MMAIATGGAITILVSTFLVGVGQVQKTVTLRAEIEDLRSIVFPKINCNEDCAGLKPGDRELGPWTVTTECHELFKDAKVSMKHKKIENLSGPLSSLDAWVCKPRRPKQCLYACHTSGIFLEKGYLFPGVNDLKTGDLNCPVGDVIGVDFSTNRVICDKIKNDLLSGPMCKQDVTFSVTNTEPHEVGISGLTACSQHTQDQARFARIGGPLNISIDPNYKPRLRDSFVIVRAEKISGRYTNAKTTIEVGPYTFRVSYQETKIVLYVEEYKKR